MNSKLLPIINPKTIKQSAISKFIIIDARSGPNAKENYLKNHLAGALYVDLNTDLAKIKSDFAQGGRHPLPKVAKFLNLLNNLGITPSSCVLVYDDLNGANAAARFWWMLKAIGHKNVQVINGGYQAAIKAGLPINSKIEKPKKSKFLYNISSYALPFVDINAVDKVKQNNDFLIIDVREKMRFDGITEPIDLVAGHIPGAINVPFATNLDGDGNFLSPKILRNKYEQLLNNRPAKNVIVHCGSGVTACHTILAMNYAGLTIPNLYVGSWSEWSRNDKPMVTL